MLNQTNTHRNTHLRTEWHKNPPIRFALFGREQHKVHLLATNMHVHDSTHKYVCTRTRTRGRCICAAQACMEALTHTQTHTLKQTVTQLGQKQQNCTESD